MKEEIENQQSIATEDDEVWALLQWCMDAIENSNPSYGELLPNTINLLERSA
jgi:hypothetical protein